MKKPEGLLYAPCHHWVRMEGETARIGMTDPEKRDLGELVFLSLPEAGETVEAGKAYGDMESVKAVSDLISPITGQVIACNEDVLDDPALINRAPYDTWILQIKPTELPEGLLSAEDYEACCAGESQHD